MYPETHIGKGHVFIGRVLTFLSITLMLTACKDNPPEPPKWLPVNPNIKTLVSPNPEPGYIGGNCTFPVFGIDTSMIYSIIGKSDVSTIGNIFKIIDSGRYPVPNSAKSLVANGDFIFLNISHDGTWLVAISDAPFLNAGRMSLINTINLKQRVISDSLSVRVFSAVFLRNNKQLIYYGKGDSLSNRPQAFYVYDLSTGHDSLLAAVSAQYYGFDVSPDGRKLIYGYRTGYRILDLETGLIDSSATIYGEWFRYSPDGTKILYCDNAIQFRAPTKEVGLIDVATEQVTMLDVNANGDPYNFNLTPFLNWSPDGKHILFSQTGLSYDGGYPGLLGLYILKKF